MAELIAERNTVDAEIGAITGRPALAGHIDVGQLSTLPGRAFPAAAAAPVSSMVGKAKDEEHAMALGAANVEQFLEGVLAVGAAPGPPAGEGRSASYRRRSPSS